MTKDFSLYTFGTLPSPLKLALALIIYPQARCNAANGMKHLEK